MKHNLLLLALSLVFRLSLSAQASVDFSGTWILDNAKSDAMFREYTITSVITQDPRTITIEKSFLDKNNKTSAMPVRSYTLDGKEKSVEEQGGINKSSAKWSPDRKSLTITETRNANNQLFGSAELYSLSADQKVLTVQISDINPGGPRMTEVYNRSR